MAFCCHLWRIETPLQHQLENSRMRLMNRLFNIFTLQPPYISPHSPNFDTLTSLQTPRPRFTPHLSPAFPFTPKIPHSLQFRRHSHPKSQPHHCSCHSASFFPTVRTAVVTLTSDRILTYPTVTHQVSSPQFAPQSSPSPQMVYSPAPRHSASFFPTVRTAVVTLTSDGILTCSSCHSASFFPTVRTAVVTLTSDGILTCSSCHSASLFPTVRTAVVTLTSDGILTCSSCHSASFFSTVHTAVVTLTSDVYSPSLPVTKQAYSLQFEPQLSTSPHNAPPVTQQVSPQFIPQFSPSSQIAFHTASDFEHSTFTPQIHKHPKTLHILFLKMFNFKRRNNNIERFSFKFNG
ncbi:hypothetical protein EVAR_3857_1 [Eumeta japonica]|uniref:Uncharacterized protein n=1 Tax=Eumeta variegata TaxID=151549 RepID=A0A4C1STU4_EUMVA|nr:hypothetical protein EVAR_3857_1 [Eumeta japonica]